MTALHIEICRRFINLLIHSPVNSTIQESTTGSSHGLMPPSFIPDHACHACYIPLCVMLSDGTDLPVCYEAVLKDDSLIGMDDWHCQMHKHGGNNYKEDKTQSQAQKNKSPKVQVRERGRSYRAPEGAKTVL